MDPCLQLHCIWVQSFHISLLNLVFVSVRFVCFPSLILLLEVILKVFEAVLQLAVFVILHLYTEFKIHFELLGFFQ